MSTSRWLRLGGSDSILLACSAALAVLTTAGYDSRAQGGGAAPATPVDVAAAVQRQMADVEEFTGRPEAAEIVEIRPRVSGTIDRVHVRDGATVPAGSLLFSIDPRPFVAEVARA